MRRISLALFLPIFALWIHTAAAQSYNGRYKTSDGEFGDVEIAMREQGGSKVAGNIRINGRNHPFTGRLAEGAVSGTLQGPEGMLFFEAELDDGRLIFVVIGRREDNQPDYEDLREIHLDVVAQPDASDTASLFSRPKPAQAGSQRSHGGGGQDPILGTFSNRQFNLTMQGGNGQYTGKIRYMGRENELQVEGQNGRYSGQVTSNEGPIPVQMALDGDMLFVQTANGGFQLMRTADPAGTKNQALAGGGARGLAAQGRAAAAMRGQQALQGGLGASGQVQGSLGAQAPALGVGALDDGTPLGRQWSQSLAGKKVTYISSYSSGSAGGYNARTEVILCADGTFQIRGNSTVTAATGGASGFAGGNQRGSGRWHILTEGQRAGVRLQYGSGESELYEMTYQGGRTYANGDRVYVTQGGC